MVTIKTQQSLGRPLPNRVCHTRCQAHTGLTHCQSVRKERLDFHINTSFVATNLARIKEYERLLESSLDDGACSVATQRIRYHNEMLIRSIFSILGFDPLAIKSNPAYEQALSFGTSLS